MNNFNLTQQLAKKYWQK